jgi:hypothetical protein
MLFKIYLYDEGKYLEQDLRVALKKTIQEITSKNYIFKFEEDKFLLYFAENEAYDVLKKAGKPVLLITALFEAWRKRLIGFGLDFKDAWFKSPIEYYDAEALLRVFPGIVTEEVKDKLEFLIGDKKLNVEFGDLRKKYGKTNIKR